ncbi:MAG: hypothetical protein OWT28_12160 [Firmicutes bacterium]|nr:hypothetical protein [Bacillota bacterium]
MNRTMRYLAYSVIFLLVIVGLLTGSIGWLIGLLAVAVLIGFTVDRFDNRRDEPFKKYNVKHHHLDHDHQA